MTIERIEKKAFHVLARKIRPWISVFYISAAAKASKQSVQKERRKKTARLMGTMW